MRGGLVTWVVVLAPLVAAAHDVAVDVSGSLITTSQNNPRAGSVGVMASGGWDVADTVSLFTNLGYTRDLPGDRGTNHVLTLRATVKVSTRWRIQASVTGQLDATSSGLGNFGGFAVLGTTVLF